LDWPEFSARPTAWAARTPGPDGNGEVSPAIILTRVLSFRNFAGFPFVVSAPPNACAAVADQALDRIARFTGPPQEALRLADLPPRAIRALREREILPQRAVAFPGKKGFKYAAVARDAASFILVNEVEHMTFGRIFPGAPSAEAFASMYGPPEEEPAHSPWAWSPAFGYLASDPNRIGPGLAVELIAHLPGLALSRQLPAARNFLAASGAGFLPAGVRQADSGSAGSAEAGLFRLIFRGRLGQNAAQAYASVLGIAEPVLRREHVARRSCLETHRKRLEVRMHQSVRTLTGSKSLTYANLLAAASFARLGAGLGMLNPQIAGILEELRVRAGSGHLAVSSGRDLAQEEEDFSRANVVRSYLDALGGEIL
jgi:protein arginine kinase